MNQGIIGGGFDNVRIVRAGVSDTCTHFCLRGMGVWRSLHVSASSLALSIYSVGETKSSSLCLVK